MKTIFLGGSVILHLGAMNTFASYATGAALALTCVSYAVAGDRASSQVSERTPKAPLGRQKFMIR